MQGDRKEHFLSPQRVSPELFLLTSVVRVSYLEECWFNLKSIFLQQDFVSQIKKGFERETDTPLCRVPKRGHVEEKTRKRL